MRSNELSPLLDGVPSLEARRQRAIHKVAEEVNLLVQLIDRLKECTNGLREPDRFSPDQYQPDDHLRAVENGQWRRACQLITAYSKPRSS
jgi:hypothetical protein